MSDSVDLDIVTLVPTKTIEEDPEEVAARNEPIRATWSNRKFRYLVYTLVCGLLFIIVITPIAVVMNIKPGPVPCNALEAAGAGCSKFASCTNDDGVLTCACHAGFSGSGQYCAPVLQESQQAGPEPNAAVGFSVWHAGDINGDGFGDVIVGAPTADGWVHGDKAGAVYIIYGQPGNDLPNLDLANLQQYQGFTIPGIQTNGSLGYYVSGNFDFNKDGLSDFVISSGFPHSPTLAPGSVYVVYGVSTSANGLYPGMFNLSTLNGTNGFVIHGESSSDNFGISVAGLISVNGDQYDDLIIGASGWSNNTGAAFIILGTNAALNPSYTIAELVNPTPGAPATLQVTAILGAQPGDNFGASVNPAGDFNLDFLNDVIIGANNANNGTGAAYVIYGRPTAMWYALFTVATFKITDGVIFHGAQQGDQTGFSVAGAADINKDGYPDVLIGSHMASPLGYPYQGAVYVLFGSSNVLPLVVNVAALDGNIGLIIAGADSNDRVGIAVSPGSDFNHDGYGDILIGAYGVSPQGKVSAGAAYLVFGQKNPWPYMIQLSDFVDGLSGYVIYGSNAGDELGTGVACIGDLGYGGVVHDFNKDGISDIVIGAPAGSMLGRAQSGYTEIVFGRLL